MQYQNNYLIDVSRSCNVVTTGNNLEFVEVGVKAMTSAQRGSCMTLSSSKMQLERDADMVAEMAQFTRDQIMSQASISMLAQANQSTMAVLKLLG